MDANVSLSIDDIRRYTGSFDTPSRVPFAVPRHFVTISQGPASEAFNIVFRGCGSASRYCAKTHYKDVMYDPKENRIVYIIRSFYGDVVGAVGRNVNKAAPVKWRRYTTEYMPYIVGYDIGSIGVIVEDCISASAVAGAGLCGVALLGTNLYGNVSEWACKFKGLIVCLDYDASLKALEVTKRLSWYVPTVTCLLKRDLKWYDEAAITAQLETSRKVLNAG